MTKKKKLASKKVKKKKCGKCCGSCRGVLWIGGSNPSNKTRDMACHHLEKGGTVYWLEGKPTGGGCVPGQPGCQ